MSKNTKTEVARVAMDAARDRLSGLQEQRKAEADRGDKLADEIRTAAPADVTRLADEQAAVGPRVKTLGRAIREALDDYESLLAGHLTESPTWVCSATSQRATAWPT